ncbi:sodium:solute symporter family protein [Rickettsia endosymbiont of Cardiosporidium cionae]|uniref:sodium:solute symporter family protein n=1 Tax=Rickettsia endosymbiont of Cardiosporidium cionae TaxID=2777155 RepID=UPI001893D27C|nr:sodium:solute symporter family protein [Rickettsia endosymbiont of Cardiosporidium cionae]
MLIIVACLVIIVCTELKKISTVDSFSYFALGNRNFTLWELVATIVATYLSASSFILALYQIHNEGLHYTLTITATYLGLIMCALFIIPRMQSFLGSLSIAEAMNKIYGKELRYIISCTIIINSVGMVAAQFRAFGSVFEYYTTINTSIAITFSSMLVIVYSTLGGIRAVIYTDFIQLAIFIGVLVIITLLSTYYLDNSGNKLLNTTEYRGFNIKKIFNIGERSFLNMLNLSCFFLIANLINPHVAHRVLLTNKLSIARSAAMIAAIILIMSIIVSTSIPISLLINDDNLASNNLIPILINKYSTIVGIPGLIIIAIISMSMSTADSWINTAAITFANDVWPSNSHKNKILAAKIFSIAIGLLGLIIALYADDLLQIILSTVSLYVGIVIPILILTIFGFRTKKLVILISMGLGFITIFIFKALDNETESSTTAALVTICATIIVHYIITKTPARFTLKINQKNNNKSGNIYWIKILQLDYQLLFISLYKKLFNIVKKQHIQHLFGGSLSIFFVILNTFINNADLSYFYQISIYIGSIISLIILVYAILFHNHKQIIIQNINIKHLSYIIIFTTSIAFNIFYVTIIKNYLLLAIVLLFSTYLLSTVINWQISTIILLTIITTNRIVLFKYISDYNYELLPISFEYIYEYVLLFAITCIKFCLVTLNSIYDNKSSFKTEKLISNFNQEIKKIELLKELYEKHQDELINIMQFCKENTKYTKTHILHKLKTSSSQMQEKKDTILYKNNDIISHKIFHKRNAHDLEAIAIAMMKSGFNTEEISAVIGAPISGLSIKINK